MAGLSFASWSCRKTQPASSGPQKGPGEAPVAAQGEAKPARKSVLLEEVRAAMDVLTGQWEGVQSCSLKIETNMKQAIEGPGTTQGTGSFDYSRKDPIPLVKFGMVNKLHIYYDQTKRYQTMETLDILVDGEFMYSTLHQPKHWVATKTAYDPLQILPFGGPLLWKDLTEHYALSLQPDELHLDRPVVVIQGLPIDGDNFISRHYFDKESGIRVKLTHVDSEGRTKLSIEVTEMTLNTTFPEGHFTFVLPEKATLVDKTLPEP